MTAPGERLPAGFLPNRIESTPYRADASPSLLNPADAVHPGRQPQSAQRIALVAMGTLVLLQPLWHGWLAPPRMGSAALAAGLATLPWSLVLLATLRDRAKGVLWGGTLALFYFAHGVALAWSGEGLERGLALGEVVLCLLVILPPGIVAWRAPRPARHSAR